MMTETTRRENVKDFLKSNIMPILREIDDLAEEQHNELHSYIPIEEQKNAEVLANFELIRMRIEYIKEIIGVYD